MRTATQNRKLSAAEQNLAASVFGATLPPWDQILVDDSLGMGDAEWTTDTKNAMGSNYQMHMGPECYPDLTAKTATNLGPVDGIFIHEMTHVWQYFHGNNVKLSSLWARYGPGGEGYGYSLGRAWSDYNCEQQGRLVENWYTGPLVREPGKNPTYPTFPDQMNTGADAFQYISKVVRKGGGAGASKTLADLKAWTP
jgi:hypothetical protein